MFLMMQHEFLIKSHVGTFPVFQQLHFEISTKGDVLATRKENIKNHWDKEALSFRSFGLAALELNATTVLQIGI
jgi:hypothetical protein